LLMSKFCAILTDMDGLLHQLRRAIEASGHSRYRISRETGVAESVLSRFVRGETGLAVETAERLAVHLGLEIVLRTKSRRSVRKGG